jgi:hypothetical protein
LALLLVVALPTASSEPLYAKSLDDEGVSLRVIPLKSLDSLSNSAL